MVSLMSDGRVIFLIWFIIAAILVASALIFLEVKVRRKKAARVEQRKIKTPSEKVLSFLKKEKSDGEKLDFIGNSAKNYFKKEYRVSLNSDYSELAEEFGKRDKLLEVSFCEKMFESYYSDNKLDEKGLLSLAGLFSEIIKRRERSKYVSSTPVFLDRFEDGMRTKLMIVSKWIGKYVNIRKEKIERKRRIVARHDSEMVRWVKKAIRRGYDKVKIESLLRDGKRSGKDVKRVLKFYDNEIRGSIKSGVERGHGIAEGIIKREKNRLNEMEAFGS